MAKLPQPFNTLVPTPWRSDMPMMFGKYKGMTVDHVMEDDPAYLVWAHENVKFFALQESLYQQALKGKRKQDAARMESIVNRVRLDQSLGLLPQYNLEREVRQMMSGSFGVHMNDLDLFVEGDAKDADWDEDHWSNMRPY